MPVQVPNTVDPMAAQMAQLLVASDADELREIVKRWVAEAPTGHQRRIYENFGARYPLVEAMGGVLSLAVLEAVVFRLEPTTSIGRALAVYTADLTLALALVAAAFIDLEHMFLPDTITIGGAILGVATSSFRGHTF